MQTERRLQKQPVCFRQASTQWLRVYDGAAAGMKTIYLRSDISPAEPLPAADLIIEPLNLTQLRRVLTES